MKTCRVCGLQAERFKEPVLLCDTHLREYRSEQRKRKRLADPEAYRARKRAQYHANPETARAQNRKSHASRREQYRVKNRRHWAAKRNWYLAKTYGLTETQVLAMFAAQGNKCAICSDPPAEKDRLEVDHCHATGRVRGLICSRCNRALGLLKDSPERARAAAAYLELKVANGL